jgi:hypothetical protein
MDDAVIADTLLQMIAARPVGGTVCPSEIARRLEPGSEAAWRALMPRIRAVAAVLAARGQVRASRGGAEVDALAPGGPIRLGRP